MVELVLAALLHLQPVPAPNWGETQAQYEQRLEVVASAIVAATPKKSHQLAVATVFWFESRFAPDVHSGTATGDAGRAVCLGQHWRGKRSKAAWQALAGTDLASTTRCAQATAGHLASGLTYCRRKHGDGGLSGWAGAFSLYATGRTCVPSAGAQGPRARARKLAGLIRRFR